MESVALMPLIAGVFIGMLLLGGTLAVAKGCCSSKGGCCQADKGGSK